MNAQTPCRPHPEIIERILATSPRPAIELMDIFRSSLHRSEFVADLISLLVARYYERHDPELRRILAQSKTENEF